MTIRADEDASDREVRDQVATMVLPRVREDALARVVTRRGLGERIALRTSDVPIALPVRGTRIAFAAIAAAAALILAVLVAQHATIASGVAAQDKVALEAVDSACANAPRTRGDSSALRHLMIAAFGVPAACGAEPGQDGPIAYVASQIRTGTFAYSSLSITDGVFTSVHPSSAITISRTTWKGVPALLAVQDGPAVTGVHLDSLIVSANGPTPLYFASIYKTQHPGGAIRAEFDSARISIVMTGHLDTAGTLAFRMKSGQLPFGFALSLAVPALPLANGWHGAIEVIPPIHPRAFKYFLRPWETISLRVIGREKIRVAAGVFDCWKVRVGEPEDASNIWVSASNHLVIRSVSVSRNGDTTFDDRRELESVVFDSH